MKNFARLAVVFWVVVLLIGCASHPLGMSTDEWNTLSSSERYEAYKEQARLNEAKAIRQAAEKNVGKKSKQSATVSGQQNH